jgi:hypothetical protein
MKEQRFRRPLRQASIGDHMPVRERVAHRLPGLYFQHVGQRIDGVLETVGKPRSSSISFWNLAHVPMNITSPATKNDCNLSKKLSLPRPRGGLTEVERSREQSVLPSRVALGRSRLLVTMKPTWIEFARMPFDLGDHPARSRPASSLIGEARIGPAHIIDGRPTGRLSKYPIRSLQDAVCRQTYGVFDPFDFEKLVDLGIGKAGIGSEINERDLAAIARHDRLQNLIPAICAGDVAGTKRAPFEVAELVEQEQLAGAGIMAVRRASGSRSTLFCHCQATHDPLVQKRLRDSFACGFFAFGIAGRQPSGWRRAACRRTSCG